MRSIKVSKYTMLPKPRLPKKKSELVAHECARLFDSITVGNGLVKAYLAPYYQGEYFNTLEYIDEIPLSGRI